jgi:hypothetical protein
MQKCFQTTIPKYLHFRDKPSQAGGIMSFPPIQGAPTHAHSQPCTHTASRSAHWPPVPDTPLPRPTESSRTPEPGTPYEFIRARYPDSPAGFFLCYFETPDNMNTNILNRKTQGTMQACSSHNLPEICMPCLPVVCIDLPRNCLPFYSSLSQNLAPLRKKILSFQFLHKFLDDLCEKSYKIFKYVL